MMLTPLAALQSTVAAVAAPGRIPWKTLLIGLAERGQLGADADALIGLALALHALESYADRDGRLFFEVHADGMVRLEIALNDWLRTVQATALGRP